MNAQPGTLTGSRPIENELPILIYDGDCGFCTTSARWGQRRLGLPSIAPWQGVALEQYGLTEHECGRAVQWVGRDGAVYSGAAAVARAMGEGGRFARLGGRLLRLPVVRNAGEVVYRLVAKNRYRLPGATDACRIGE